MHFLMIRAARRGLIRTASRHFLTTTACVLALLANSGASGAMAQSAAAAMPATRTYAIPAQPMAAALNSFGRQSGLQISLAAEAARGVTSQPVKGSLTVDQALSQLLAGTGISYRIGNGVVVVGTISSAATDALPEDGSAMIGEITVTEAGAATSVSSVHIGSEQLQARNPASIADVFRDEAGVSVGSSIPTSQKVYVNGLEETTLAVNIDGSRQNNRVFHHNATNLIDASLLKAVDVNAGIAPADVGPGALAGSIAYETKDARDLMGSDGFGGTVSETYNTNSRTFTTGLGGWGMQDGFEFLGFLSYGKRDSYKAGQGEAVRGTETNLMSGLAKFAYEAESGDRFEFSHERVRDDAERPYRANASIVTTGRAWEPAFRNYRIERENTVFTYTNSTPEGWWDPTFRIAYSQSSVETPVFYDAGGGFGASYPSIGESGSLNGKFENRFALENGNIVAGIDFYSDKIKLDTMTDGLGFSDDSLEKAGNIGIYSQVRIEPYDRTRLSFGGRVDKQWFEGTGGQTFDHAGASGNASIEHDLTSVLTAKAGASHVWAGIPLAESFIMNPNWNYGAKGPEATTANNVMIGLEAHFEGFTAEGSLFRSRINDARIPRYAAARANDDYDVVSEGFQLGAGYDWIDGHIKLSYAHIETIVDGRPVDSDTGNYLATPVGKIFTVAAAHSLNDWGLTVGGDLEFAPEFDSGATTYESYEVVNLYADYKPEVLPHMTFRAEIQNLFNETYSSRATYGQEFSNVEPLYEQGRTFLLSVKATF